MIEQDNFNNQADTSQDGSGDDSYQGSDQGSPKDWAFKFFLIMSSVIILLIVAIALLGNYYFKNQASGQKSNNLDIDNLSAQVSLKENPARTAAEKKNRPHLGNLNAPLVIVEFGDFQCDKSQLEFSQIRQAVLKYPDDVLFIFRNFPVIDDNSNILAKAGICADEQGKFWQFHDKLYMNQGNLISVTAVNELALQSGIDISDFSSCLSSDKYNARLQEDVNDAGALAVIGTPTFYVNGNKIEGAVSANDWEQIILKFKELNQN